MSSGNERQRALWATRIRALQRLAEAHPEEFQELRDDELTKLGEPLAPRRVTA